MHSNRGLSEDPDFSLNVFLRSSSKHSSSLLQLDCCFQSAFVSMTFLVTLVMEMMWKSTSILAFENPSKVLYFQVTGDLSFGSENRCLWLGKNRFVFVVEGAKEDCLCSKVCSCCLTIGSDKNLLWSQVLSPHIHKLLCYNSITGAI